MRRQRLIIPLILIILLTAGCVKRSGSTVPVTGMEKVMSYNANLAVTNDEIAKGVISAQQANLISKAHAATITEGQFKIAKADKALTAILVQGQSYSAQNATQVRQLIDEIKTEATGLIQSGAISITDPKSQAAITSDVNAVINLADLLITTLQGVGVLQ